jgi:cyclopropane fatty-acyl-phospholipid synthase-like methyltransferase
MWARKQLSLAVQRARFAGSAAYWESRYRRAGNSGAWSYGEQAAYKAWFLNRFVAEHSVERVIEFGCGDGNQLSLAKYPEYLGLDVSETAVRTCIERFSHDPAKSFLIYSPDLYADPAGFLRADAAVSLDVVYHLTEDDTFERYMTHLFSAAQRFVVIYATDGDRDDAAPHVRHRRFSEWVVQNTSWRAMDTVLRPSPEWQDFVVYVP